MSIPVSSHSYLLQCIDLEDSIRQVYGLSPDLGRLQDLAHQEGFKFLDRLVYDFKTAANRFDQQGEGLFEFRIFDQLIAIVGLNREMNFDLDHLLYARLRRFYLHPDYRRLGLGEALVKHIEDYAKVNFHGMTLFTNTAMADQFYLACGFEHSHIQANVSHVKIF